MTNTVDQALEYHARAGTEDETTLFGVHGIRVTLGDLKHALAKAREASSAPTPTTPERTGPRLGRSADQAATGQSPARPASR
jgi:hypothetical protein